MAYTIKGLAKANECESFDCYGLATVWQYWYTCNHNEYGKKHVIDDFKLLRKADRQEMINWLRMENEYFIDVLNIIESALY
jgi:hypothetical protein